MEERKMGKVMKIQSQLCLVFLLYCVKWTDAADIDVNKSSVNTTNLLPPSSSPTSGLTSVFQNLDLYLKKFLDFSEEVNGMMKFYANIEVRDGFQNETVFPSMPNFEELFPDFVQYLPAKGSRVRRQVWRGAAAATNTNSQAGFMPFLMQMICQQQGVSTVPGPLISGSGSNNINSNSNNINNNNDDGVVASNRPSPIEFRPAPRKPAARIRNPYRRGKRGAARRRRPRPPPGAAGGNIFGNMNNILPMLLLSQMSNRPSAATGAGNSEQNGAMTGGAAQGAGASQGTGAFGNVDIGQLLLQSMCLSASLQQSGLGGIGAATTAHPLPPGHPTPAPAGGVGNFLLPTLLGLDPGLGTGLGTGLGLGPIGGTGLGPIGGVGGGLNPLGGTGGLGGLGPGAGFPSLGGPG